LGALKRKKFQAPKFKLLKTVPSSKPIAKKKTPRYAPGRINSLQDNILLISGLENVLVGELLQHSNSIKALVMNIEYNFIKAVLVSGTPRKIKSGHFIWRTGKALKTVAGFGVLGQILNPLGECLNIKSMDPMLFTEIKLFSTSQVELLNSSPSIIQRSPVSLPFMTGITAIDCFLPIGCVYCEDTIIRNGASQFIDQN
jgi:F-type H+-transporting ATPase subunit alpha